MEDLPQEDTINMNYIIQSKKGSGGTASVFLVKPRNVDIIYAAKVLKSNDEIIKKMNDNEIKYLNILSEQNCPYIIKIIDNGEGPIVRKEKNNGEPLTRKYIILENAPKRELADYIIYTHEGLKEDLGKLIFYKILKGIQVIHGEEICHKDIKLENILLDDKFNPKIADFGLAMENSSELDDFENGTLSYLPPELLEHKPYDGKKFDIFSLGATLIYLITGNSGFKYAVKGCDMYKKIMDNDELNYWKIIENNCGCELSKDFKDLYFKMVSYNPNTRPDVQNIMEHPWFKPIREMDESQLENLEKETEKELNDRENKIKDMIEDEVELSDDEEDNSNCRSAADEEEGYFNWKNKLEEKPKQFNMAFCIKIKSNKRPYSLMNDICKKIEDEMDDCFINADEKKLKFKVEFKDENENGKKFIKGNSVTMKAKLYRDTNVELLLKFTKIKGSKKNFFDKFTAISKLIKQKNN